MNRVFRCSCGSEIEFSSSFTDVPRGIEECACGNWTCPECRVIVDGVPACAIENLLAGLQSETTRKTFITDIWRHLLRSPWDCFAWRGQASLAKVLEDLTEAWRVA